MGGEGFGVGQEQDGIGGQVIEERGEGGAGAGAGAFEEAEFAGGRQGDGGDGVAGDLGDGIEVAEGFEFVAEKFQAHGPGTGGRKDIDDAAAQGEFAFLGDLRLGLVALFLEIFDERERVQVFAAGEGAGAALEIGEGKGALEEGGGIGDDDRGGGARGIGEGDEGLEAFADDVGVGQLAFMGKDFPSGEKERRGGEPGFEVLLKTLLPFQIFRHQHPRPVAGQRLD